MRILFFVLLSFILKGQQFDLGCSDYVSMANDYRDDDLFSLSLDAYSNCLEIDSNYLEVYVNRGELYSKMKEFNLALNDYNYAEYLGLKSVGLYEVKSDLNYKLNNYLLAIENLNIAISLASEGNKKSDLYFKKGKKQVDEKEYKNAIQSFTKCIELDISDDKTYCLEWATIGECYFLMENYILTIDSYTKAIENSREYYPNKTPRYLLDRAEAYQLIGSYNMAIKDLTEVIESNHKKQQSLIKRSIAYYDIQKYQLAIDDCTEAIDLDSTYFDAYFNRAKAFDKLPKGDNEVDPFDLAIMDYTKAIEINYLSSESYNNRANIYSKQGKNNFALADYLQSIKIDSLDFLVYRNIALEYSNIDSLQRALDFIDKSIKINPNIGKSYYLRAEFNNSNCSDYKKACLLNYQKACKKYQSKCDY